jgi:hypothetical protein
MKNGNSSGKTQGGNQKKTNKPKRQNTAKYSKRQIDYLAEARQKAKDRDGKSKKLSSNRPKWSPPPLLTTPVILPVCSLCEKPIKEAAAAITDKVSGQPAHFDCIRNRISESETLSEGDTVSYIGGGRFGVINFKDKAAGAFKIKKIIEWEQTEKRSEWRNDISDHFSLT